MRLSLWSLLKRCNGSTSKNAVLDEPKKMDSFGDITSRFEIHQTYLLMMKNRKITKFIFWAMTTVPLICQHGNLMALEKQLIGHFLLHFKDFLKYKFLKHKANHSMEIWCFKQYHNWIFAGIFFMSFISIFLFFFKFFPETN